MSSRFAYRGATVDQFNQDVFRDNTVDGTVLTLHHIPASAVEEALEGMVTSAISRDTALERIGQGLKSRYGDLETLREAVGVDTRTVAVTGGFSQNLATAVRFSAGSDKGPGVMHVETPSDAPLVLFFNEQDLPGNLVEVEYTNTWAKQHPDILAFVAGWTEYVLSTQPTKMNGEELLAIAHLRDDGNRFGTLSVLSRFRTASQEEELVCKAGEVNLDASAFAAASYLKRDEAARLMAHLTDDVPDPIGGRVTNPTRRAYTRIDPKERLSVLHDAISSAMHAMGDRLVIVEWTSPAFPPTKGDVFREDDFLHAYDGTTLVTDYHTAAPYTDPTLL